MSETNGKRILDRAAILGAAYRKIEDQETPEWGGVTRLKVMSLAEREEYEAPLLAAKEGETPAHVRASLLVRTIVDEGGNRCFADGDIPLLEAQDNEVLNRLFVAAAKLNRLGKEDLASAVKDSGPTPPDSAPISSPTGSAAAPSAN